jgi:cobalt-precorrin-6B (C15)-methyltransferase
MNRNWPYTTPGIPDHLFIREQGVPMTKCEIRALSIAKLNLFPNAVVYDVGAGSGSVAVECKRFLPQGKVFAIEKNPKALNTIRKNCEKFKVDLEIVDGTAPEALIELPQADRIFIGGSGGNLK